jgi:hypothetical protein
MRKATAMLLAAILVLGIGPLNTLLPEWARLGGIDTSAFAADYTGAEYDTRALTLGSGAYTLTDYSKQGGVHNGEPNSAIAIAPGANVVLTIKGTVKLTGANAYLTKGAGAGIYVPETSTLTIKGDGTLTVLGGNAAKNAKVLQNDVEVDTGGGGGAAAGIGSRGGDGGAGTTQTERTGKAAEVCGSIAIIETVTVKAMGGTGGGLLPAEGRTPARFAEGTALLYQNNGHAGDGGYYYKNIFTHDYRNQAGTGGVGGSGSGYPATGIGNGGSGGGKGGPGNEGEYDSGGDWCVGGVGGGGAAGFVAGGGGGGGNGVAAFLGGPIGSQLSFGPFNVGGSAGGPSGLEKGESGVYGHSASDWTKPTIPPYDEKGAGGAGGVPGNQGYSQLQNLNATTLWVPGGANSTYDPNRAGGGVEFRSICGAITIDSPNVHSRGNGGLNSITPEHMRVNDTGLAVGTSEVASGAWWESQTTIAVDTNVSSPREDMGTGFTMRHNGELLCKVTVPLAYTYIFAYATGPDGWSYEDRWLGEGNHVFSFKHTTSNMWNSALGEWVTAATTEYAYFSIHNSKLVGSDVTITKAGARHDRIHDFTMTTARQFDGGIGFHYTDDWTIVANREVSTAGGYLNDDKGQEFTLSATFNKGFFSFDAHFFNRYGLPMSYPDWESLKQGFGTPQVFVGPYWDGGTFRTDTYKIEGNWEQYINMRLIIPADNCPVTISYRVADGGTGSNLELKNLKYREVEVVADERHTLQGFDPTTLNPIFSTVSNEQMMGLYTQAPTRGSTTSYLTELNGERFSSYSGTGSLYSKNLASLFDSSDTAPLKLYGVWFTPSIELIEPSSRAYLTAGSAWNYEQVKDASGADKFVASLDSGATMVGVYSTGRAAQLTFYYQAEGTSRIKVTTTSGTYYADTRGTGWQLFKQNITAGDKTIIISREGSSGTCRVYGFSYTDNVVYDSNGTLLISSRGDLEVFKALVESGSNLNARLTTNISLSGANWMPIKGNYSGTFDGAGFAITDMTAAVSAGSDISLGAFFESVGSPTFKNLEIVNLKFTVTLTENTVLAGPAALIGKATGLLKFDNFGVSGALVVNANGKSGGTQTSGLVGTLSADGIEARTSYTAVTGAAYGWGANNLQIIKDAQTSIVFSDTYCRATTTADSKYIYNTTGISSPITETIYSGTNWSAAAPFVHAKNVAVGKATWRSEDVCPRLAFGTGANVVQVSVTDIHGATALSYLKPGQNFSYTSPNADCAYLMLNETTLHDGKSWSGAVDADLTVREVAAMTGAGATYTLETEPEVRLFAEAYNAGRIVNPTVIVNGSVSAKEGWTPIGTAARPFVGTASGLGIVNGAPLFGVVGNARFTKMAAGTQIEGSGDTGGLVNRVVGNAVFDSCYLSKVSSGQSISGAGHVGGLVGSVASGASVKISKCDQIIPRVMVFPPPISSTIESNQSNIFFTWYGNGGTTNITGAVTSAGDADHYAGGLVGYVEAGAALDVEYAAVFSYVNHETRIDNSGGLVGFSAGNTRVNSSMYLNPNGCAVLANGTVIYDCVLTGASAANPVDVEATAGLRLVYPDNFAFSVGASTKEYRLGDQAALWYLRGGDEGVKYTGWKFISTGSQNVLSVSAIAGLTYTPSGYNFEKLSLSSDIEIPMAPNCQADYSEEYICSSGFTNGYYPIRLQLKDRSRQAYFLKNGVAINATPANYVDYTLAATKSSTFSDITVLYADADTGDLLVRTPAELAQAALLANAGATALHVRLAASIDVSAAPGFAGFGTAAHPFAGTFVGDGFALDNLPASGLVAVAGDGLAIERLGVRGAQNDGFLVSGFDTSAAPGTVTLRELFTLAAPLYMDNDSALSVQIDTAYAKGALVASAGAGDSFDACYQTVPLQGAEPVSGLTPIAESALASGELAWLLRDAFGQKIDNSGAQTQTGDAWPVFLTGQNQVGKVEFYVSHSADAPAKVYYGTVDARLTDPDGIVSDEDGEELGLVGWETASGGQPGTLFTAELIQLYAVWAQTHSISISVEGQGTVSANRTNAPSGAQIALLIEAEPGWELGEIAAASIGEDAEPVVLSDRESYQMFTMPDKAVAVQAEFVKSQPLLDSEAVGAAAVLVAEGGWSVAQATANTQPAVSDWFEATVAQLLDAAGLVLDRPLLTPESFEPAVAGERIGDAGTDGSFAFAVTLGKGAASQEFSVSGTIVATLFVGTQETQPGAAIDYAGEMLTGLAADAGYTVNGTPKTADGDGKLEIDSDWFGETLSIVKTGDGIYTTNSDAQSLSVPAHPPVPSITAIQPAAIGETGGIGGTTAAMEYGTDQLSWTDCADGSTTGLAAGVYYVRVKVSGEGFGSESTSVAIAEFEAAPEEVPDAAVDYVGETLAGLAANAGYTVDGVARTADGDGKIAIDRSWFGVTVSIVKTGNGATTTDSDALLLSVPARPAAPVGADGTDETYTGFNDGTIINVTDAMEYSVGGGTAWAAISGTTVSGLAPVVYFVRFSAAPDACFASENAEVAIGASSIAATYVISLNKAGTHTFAAADYGYGAQNALTVTVGNTGNQPTGGLAVALSGNDVDSFALSLALIGGIAAESSDSFTVAPKTGLATGTYSATVTVSGNGGIPPQSFNVSFTVKQAPPSDTPMPGGGDNSGSGDGGRNTLMPGFTLTTGSTPRPGSSLTTGSTSASTQALGSTSASTQAPDPTLAPDPAQAPSSTSALGETIAPWVNGTPNNIAAHDGMEAKGAPTAPSANASGQDGQDTGGFPWQVGLLIAAGAVLIAVFAGKFALATWSGAMAKMVKKK